MQTADASVTDGRAARGRTIDSAFWAILIALPSLVALASIGSAFWLDETMTYWTIRGGFADIVRRCTVSPHPILYSGLMWGIDQLAGHSEIVFRLPSILAIVAAAYVLYRLARDEVGRETALTAVVLFVSAPDVMYAAADARPYAIGVFAVTASSLLLLRWVRTGGLGYALAYAAIAAVVPHIHIMFTPVLGAHGLYFVLAARRKRTLLQAAAVLMLFAALVAPLGPQFIEAARTRVAHSFSPAPGIADLFWSIIPSYALGWGLGVAALVAAAWPMRVTTPRLEWRMAVFVLAWTLLPSILLWAISVAGDSPVFVRRFLLSTAPGSALLFAVTLQTLDSRPLRRAFVAIPVTVVLVYWCWSGLILKHCTNRGDWRSALAFVERHTAQDSAPVLIRSQYIESDFMDWRSVRFDDSILFTPLAYYPARANFMPLPVSMAPEVASYLDEFAARAKGRNRRFLLMAYSDPRPVSPFIQALRKSLPSWRVLQAGNFDEIRVYEFRPQ